MNLPSNFFQSKPVDRHLLAIEFNPAQTRLAYFHDNEGELIFGGSAQGPTPEASYEALSAKPGKITDIILGLPFHDLTDSSTVVRYRRSLPQEKISEDEVKNALSQVPPISGGELFFEDLFNAKIDGLPSLEPVERMGEVVELNYYQAAASEQVLKEVKELVKKFGVTPGMVPTAYAVAKLIAQTAPKGALTLDIDPTHTEVSLSSEGHLVGIKSFDIGSTDLEMFIPALETALEEMEYPDLWPEAVYLCGTSPSFENIRSALLAYPWTKKVNMMSFPEISVFHPVSVNLTLPADVGLNALSLLG
ncbi:MAG TPA: hypothetical protein VFK94_04820 [Patescibacteria group bacterium]|nr:hypothetical protein [Patescibacteria group bacterium]